MGRSIDWEAIISDNLFSSIMYTYLFNAFPKLVLNFFIRFGWKNT